MASSTSAAAGAIPSGPPSTLSPNAAPYTLLARQARAPPGRLHDGDASRLIDDNFVLNGEDSSSCSVLLTAQFGMKQSDTVYSSSAHGTRQGQPSSTCGISVGVYPSPTSSIGIVSEPSVTIASDFNQHLVPLTSGKGIRQPRVTIRSPPNKTSETNNTVFGSVSKLAIRRNDESNKETGKHVSFSGNLELSNPAHGSGNSKGTLVLSKELNPECSVKPLIPSACASPCVTMADDVNPEPSECSVDSPCWRGTASRLSPFDGLPTLVAQSVKQEPVTFDAGQEQSSSAHCETPTELQNLVSSKSTHNHVQSHVELGLSKEPGGIGTNVTHYSHGKEQFVKLGAANRNADRHCSVIDNCIKRSGLNSAAPDFVPLSARKSNTGDATGSCSSSGVNVSGILEAIKSLSEVLCNNFSDEIELEEQDHCLLQSVIENLQSCLHKASKVPVMVASDKSGGLKACYAQNAVSKSVVGDYNGSYTADNGKSIIISNLGDCGRLVGDLRKRSGTRYQSALSNFPKELSWEEHSEALIFMKLWSDAEREIRNLKYQLKQTRVQMDLESSMPHIGGGPRNHSFHLCDMAVDPSSSYGSSITYPLMLKGHPGGRKTHNLLSAADCIQSGDSSVLSRSKDYIAVRGNIEDEYFLSGSEETGVHPHAHPGLQVAPSRALRRLNTSTSDGMPSSSYITGRDDILRGSCEFGSSDWEHVLKEEIGST